MDIYNTVISNLDKGKNVIFIFCDIAKAFDKVWHWRLFLELQNYGIKDKILKWFENYLCNIEQEEVLCEGLTLSIFLKLKLVFFKVLF